MQVTNHARARATSVVVLLVLTVALVSCSGDSGTANNPVGGSTSSPPAATPPAPTQGTGILAVSIADPDGKPLANASVTIYNQSQTGVLGAASSDQKGMAILERLPAVVSVSVSHPLGFEGGRRVDVPQTGSSALSVVIHPDPPTTIGLLSVSVPAEGISADRTELELHVSIVASALSQFVPSSYGKYTGAAPPTPLLRLGECVVWLDASSVDPSCDGPVGKQVTVTDYTYDPVGRPAPDAAQGQYNVLLLLDQSRRATEYDPYGLRTLAAKHLIRRSRSIPQPDLLAVAGFAGQGGDTSAPPLLQHLPLWIPPSTTTVFTADLLAQEAAVDSLQPLVGGSAPVFDALRAAMTLTVARAPATGRRAIVALLGGDDDSGLSASQRKAALVSLRQLRADTSVQPILIAGRLDEDSAQRKSLAEMAAALHAPIIYAGYPRNWKDQTDGLYSAMDLAADLLAGSALPTVEAVFRMKSDQPGAFQSGSLVSGTLYVESDQCPMGCWELPLQFAAEVP